MPSDNTKIALHLRAARRRDQPISDACARVIASQWHKGQASTGYAFASSGRIAPSAQRVWDDLFADFYRDLRGDDRAAADALRVYLTNRARHGQTGPVPGWHRLWL